MKTITEGLSGEVRVCNNCKEIKSVEDFHRHKRMKYGRYSTCKICISEQNKLDYLENKKSIDEYNRNSYYKHKPKRAETAKKYYQANSEEIKEKVKEWTDNNKPKAISNWRSSQLKRKYGITVSQYEELLEQQNYRCAICDKHMDDQKNNMHVDHAHTESEFVPAGMIRGILCWTCNLKLIGKNTNPNIFEKAAAYLKQHTGWMVPNDKIKPKKKRKKRSVKKS